MRWLPLSVGLLLVAAPAWADGWYLLMPPVVADPEYLHVREGLYEVRPVLEAPLGSWQQYGAYATAQECQTERRKYIDILTEATKRARGRLVPMPAEVVMAITSRCIATDDPRLVPRPQ